MKRAPILFFLFGLLFTVACSSEEAQGDVRTIVSPEHGEKKAQAIGRKQRMELLDGFIENKAANSDKWSSETEVMLRLAIEEHAAANGGSPVANDLVCLKQGFCRLVLDHKERMAALVNNSAIARRGMFTWKGAMISKGKSGTEQTLYLLRKDFRFDRSASPAATVGNKGEEK